MKISNLLNNSLVILLLFYFFSQLALANEPIDIWKIEKIVDENKITKEDKKIVEAEIIQGVKIEQENKNIIVDEKLDTSSIKLAGLYDPDENGLSIDMWTNSDGGEIKNLFKKIDSMELSNFSKNLLDIVILTNSYFPKNNISSEEFINFKFKYLKNKKDFELIKKFLIRNPSIKNSDILVQFYADYYLSNSQVDKACEIFNYVNLISDDYLTNFKIFCLITENKKEQAQLLFDLKSELSAIDDFFIKKFNVLMEYEIQDELLSDESILNFHLSYKTNKNFIYEPNINTPKFIWKYLSSANLLKETDLVDIENSEQVELIEKATNEEVYSEEELLNLYKRFQFDLNQLINVNDVYKILPEYKGRALLYQRLLLTVDVEQKLILSSKLNELFKDSNLQEAFDEELSKILKEIDSDKIPSNFTTFYKNNKEPDIAKPLKIKLNNKIIHQSKLLNYFLNKTSLPKVEKETNDILKKFKKNKKYFFSKKDIIMIESLRSDGVQILKKYDSLYEYKKNIPTEISSKIVNGELGLVLLRLIDTIGEDRLEDLDIDSIGFIVEILNELKMIEFRNEVLLKVLPLKV